MTPATMRIEAILANEELDREDAPSSKCEEIEKLIPELGWDAVLEIILEILRTDRCTDDWRTAAEVLWGAALDRRPMPVDLVIAHLCHRWPPDEEEDNLAWSITAKLKKVGYLSEYEPLSDPAVCEQLVRLRGAG